MSPRQTARASAIDSKSKPCSSGSAIFRLLDGEGLVVQLEPRGVSYSSSRQAERFAARASTPYFRWPSTIQARMWRGPANMASGSFGGFDAMWGPRGSQRDFSSSSSIHPSSSSSSSSSLSSTKPPDRHHRAHSPRTRRVLELLCVSCCALSVSSSFLQLGAPGDLFERRP